MLGIVLAVLGAYAPELFEEELVQFTEQRKPRASISFEFDQILSNSEVVSDPRIYLSPNDADPDKPVEYLLQAASFRNQDDAEVMRVKLLLMDLPTNSYRVQLENGTWFRVLTGPFSTQIQAQRAMTRLRQHNISALLIKRPVSSG